MRKVKVSFTGYGLGETWDVDGISDGDGWHFMDLSDRKTRSSLKVRFDSEHEHKMFYSGVGLCRANVVDAIDDLNGIRHLVGKQIYITKMGKKK